MQMFRFRTIVATVIVLLATAHGVGCFHAESTPHHGHGKETVVAHAHATDTVSSPQDPCCTSGETGETRLVPSPEQEYLAAIGAAWENADALFGTNVLRDAGSGLSGPSPTVPIHVPTTVLLI